MKPHGNAGGRRTRRPALILLMILHAILLAWGGWRQSPTNGEAGMLPSGLYHWHTGRFELFRVNPPLIRMLATVPVLPVCPDIPWPGTPERGPLRAEWDYGRVFVETVGEDAQWLFALARWACIPLSLIGLWVCQRWAAELFGQCAGMLAATLWCFSPNILAHGQLMTTDVATTSLGTVAAYLFWHWLKKPSWATATKAGLMLGVVELTKMSWLILFGLWPAIWAVWRVHQYRSLRWPSQHRDFGQMACVLVLGLYVLNLGYGFDGTGQNLGDYRFFSRALTGDEYSEQWDLTGGNRFQNTRLASLPVPVPREYLRGLDRQKWDFDRPRESYLCGQWRDHGWWYYYLFGMMIKVPLGTWLLGAAAAVVAVADRRFRVSTPDEWFLLVTPLAILFLVSSQTGFNKHLRYVLPAFPLLMISVSRVATTYTTNAVWLSRFTVMAMICSTGSSLWIYPHTYSYFNELVGGPKNGHKYLSGSNLCSGQDLLFLKRWLSQRPDATPLAMSFNVVYDAQVLGIGSAVNPNVDANMSTKLLYERRGPWPGWFALDARQLICASGRHAYFNEFDPVAFTGYSIRVYHITLEEANRVRRRLAMPEIPNPAKECNLLSPHRHSQYATTVRSPDPIDSSF